MAKNRADGSGRETALEFNQEVDIAIFAEGVGDIFTAEEEGRLLYLKSVKVGDQGARFSITVDGRPGRVAIDPFNKLIDRNRANNFADLE